MATDVVGADNAVAALVRRMAAAMRPPRIRSMREFAEAEIIVPDGPCKGQRFRVARNPFAGLWFAAIDSGRFRRFAATGPTQTGKTFICNVIPTLYHLFERRESVVYGVPNMDLANDKLAKDLMPAIRASRYAELLPKRGAGSLGGEAIELTFGNGASLRFMSARGGDESRSGYTARVVVATEIDKMDEPGEASKEADPITQLERRTDAYGDDGRVYLECTPSLESGRIWQEITVRGTDSRIAVRCPHCGQFVTPEREHLVGWHDAADVIAAGESARVVCPACGELWREADRAAANRDALLVHKGQEVAPDGTVTGPAPRTDTLGFRWTVLNNLLASNAVALVARDEWAAKRAPDEDNAEKALLQFKYARPYRPARVDLTAIDADAISKRVAFAARGKVPADVHSITVAVDLGKYLCHWGAIGWRENATPHVIEYGRLEVASAELGEEAALLAALRTFRDTVCADGWAAAGDQKVRPALGLVDAGWHQEVALLFCAESPGFVPAKGRGSAQLTGGLKTRRETGSKVVAVGDGYELVQLPGEAVPLVEIDVDKWKSWVHARLQTPMEKPGALTLYQDTPIEHRSFARHLTAERKVEEFVAGRGLVTRWQMLNRNNHWLDVLMMASVAGHAIGERLMGEPDGVRVQISAPAASQTPPSGFMDSFRNRY